MTAPPQPVVTETRLSARRIICPVHLGCGAEERAQEQSVAFTVTWACAGVMPVCMTDQVGDTLCYAELEEHVLALCRMKPYHTVEHLAYTVWHAVAQLIHKTPLDVADLVVEAHKLAPPLRQPNDGACCRIQGRP